MHYDKCEYEFRTQFKWVEISSQNCIFDSLLSKGPIKLTWSEVKIGIQSSIIVFPVNLVIVGIFRHSRPRKKKTKKEKKQKQSEAAQMEKDIPYETASPLFDQNNLTVDFLIQVSPLLIIMHILYDSVWYIVCPIFTYLNIQNLMLSIHSKNTVKIVK